MLAAGQCPLQTQKDFTQDYTRLCSDCETKKYLKGGGNAKGSKGSKREPKSKVSIWEKRAGVSK